MSDFVTAFAEYITGDDGEIPRTGCRAHRITCMRGQSSSSGSGGNARLRRVVVNGQLLKSPGNQIEMAPGTKIEGMVISEFTVTDGNFLVEYLEPPKTTT